MDFLIQVSLKTVYDNSKFFFFFLSFVGTTGIVDYTNYDDMKYAVSWLCCSFMWYFVVNCRYFNTSCLYCS